MIKRKETALRNPHKYNDWSDELWADRDCVLAAVQQNGLVLQHASEELRADREVVLAAVQQDGNALRYASEGLRADRKVVLAAVRQDGRALCYVSKDLRADRDVVLAAVQQNGWALKYAGEDPCADREVVLTAVQSCGYALEYASEELRADREVVLTAVQQNGNALFVASEYLCADREVVFTAVQQDANALHFADETLRQDERFVAELADVCPLSSVWYYMPQVTLADTAQRAMRSKEGLLLLAKQARVSLLGEPTMMKELLLSALEQGCLKDALQMLIDSQRKSVLDALRTVMAWYGLDVPTDALVDLPPDSESAEVFCNTALSALAGTCA